MDIVCGTLCVGGGGPSKIQARVKEEFKARYNIIVLYCSLYVIFLISTIPYVFFNLVCTVPYPHLFLLIYMLNHCLRMYMCVIDTARTLPMPSCRLKPEKRWLDACNNSSKTRELM